MEKIFTSKDAIKALPQREKDSHKGTYGYVALLGGSLEYSGAIRLSALGFASMVSGAGVTLIALPKSLSFLMTREILECVLYPLSDEEGHLRFNEEEIQSLLSKVKVLSLGMGLGMSNDVIELVRYVLEHYTGTLILDADALNALATLDRSLLRRTPSKVILTPHLKEFSRLSGKTLEEIKEKGMELALDYARDTGAVVLLKGARTMVTDGKEVHLIERGSPGMATAGSGDVLTGIITGLCGYNSDLLLSASTGAYINGVAGELAAKEKGEISMLARNTASFIPEAITIIQESKNE